MHSPQPFPSGSAPVAVQSRPVSNRTYSAEIPRLDRCRHSSSAATSRIIAYQKRSHARISVPYENPFCKPFLRDFPDFFRNFFAAPHLVPPCRRAHKISSPAGAYYYNRAGWMLLLPAGGVFVKKSVITSGGASLIKGLISTPARRGLTFVRAKVSKTRSRGTGSPLTNPFPVALLRWIRIYF